MFRRQPGPTGDLVAAAQRRLAALADLHASAGEPARGSLRASGLPDPATQPAGSEAGDEARSVTQAAGRHVGMRRVELRRWGVTGHHVVVATLCVVVLVVIVAWWALRSVPHAESITVNSQRTLPSGPVSGEAPSGQESVATSTGLPSGFPSGSGPAAGSTPLVVDVAGKVRQPGIVELPPGSRVVDAIAAAGGARPRVSLTALNLARVLVDGEQIVVGMDVPILGTLPPTGPAGGSPTGQITPVALNTATAEQLDTLPGIGPVTAQAILQWRADNGPFIAVDDLLAVSGIGDATIADLRPYVYV